MEYLRKLSFVFGFLALIVVLVIARTSNNNLFRQDSKRAISLAQKGNNLISLIELESLSEEYLIVDLGSKEKFNSLEFQNAINIPFENILKKEAQQILKETEGEIILFAEDYTIVPKAWVILNQLGYSKVYMLQPEGNREVFKYKFQPDTTTRLE